MGVWWGLDGGLMRIHSGIHSGIPIEGQVGIHSRYGVNRGMLRGLRHHIGPYGVMGVWGGSDGGLLRHARALLPLLDPLREDLVDPAGGARGGKGLMGGGVAIIIQQPMGW